MAAQFLHLGTYGRRARGGEPAWSCIEGISAEGARAPSACGHVPYKTEPTQLFGVSPIVAGREAIEVANQAVDAKGRKLRIDGVAFIAGVISYPIERGVVDSMIGDADWYQFWKHSVVDWLRKVFGKHLRSVVEHTDEKFYHVHFYCIPGLDEDRRLDLDVFHPGRRSKAEAAAGGAAKKKQDAAYREGMRAFQDRFFEEVSRSFGHDRFGPRRARVARKERLLERALEEERVRLQNKAERDIVEAAAEARAAAHKHYAARINRLDEQYQSEAKQRLTAEQEISRLQAQLAELTCQPGLR